MAEPAGAFPAAVGEHEEIAVSTRERLRFRDNLGLGLRHLRGRPAFAALERGPWQVFVAIACHWQANAEAWPSQETIATFSGYSARAVRDYVTVLERSGVVRLRRERSRHGADRIYYAPGIATATELAAFAARFPKGPVKARWSQRPELGSATPQEAISGAPPEAISMEPRDEEIEPFSFCGSTREQSASAAEEEELSIATENGETGTGLGGRVKCVHPRDPIELSGPCEAREVNAACKTWPMKAPGLIEQECKTPDEDLEVARAALVERMRRKHPARPVPQSFDEGELALVIACARALKADRIGKTVAMSDAIAGAFIASKEGPPTVRFIWEKLDHFLDHVERGRRRRLADERDTTLRARVERGERTSRATLVPAVALTRANMEADVARLFGRKRRTQDPQ